MDNLPDIRIGDPERSQVIDFLSQHYANGYLNLEEFEDRTGKAAQATYKKELAALTADLPDEPLKEAKSSLDTEVELQELQNKGRRIQSIDAIIWGAAIIFMFVGIFADIPNWWMVFPIAGIASWVTRGVLGVSDEDEKTFEKLERKEKKDRQERLEQAYNRKRELGK